MSQICDGYGMGNRLTVGTRISGKSRLSARKASVKSRKRGLAAAHNRVGPSRKIVVHCICQHTVPNLASWPICSIPRNRNLYNFSSGTAWCSSAYSRWLYWVGHSTVRPDGSPARHAWSGCPADILGGAGPALLSPSLLDCALLADTYCGAGLNRCTAVCSWLSCGPPVVAAGR
jgi:hypothetical protein